MKQSWIFFLSLIFTDVNSSFISAAYYVSNTVHAFEIYLKLHLGHPAFICSPVFNRENMVNVLNRVSKIRNLSLKRIAMNINDFCLNKVRV